MILLASGGLLPLWSAEPAPSRAAAERCTEKIKEMERFIPEKASGKSLSTPFTEEEINSYLQLVLKPRYHPSLRTLQVRLGQDRLHTRAVIDFDRLRTSTTGVFRSLLALMFSGTRTLDADGKLHTGDGRGRYELEQARFDGRTLPNGLVNEIIAAVGMRQTPPFNPTESSTLPYGIERVDLEPGRLVAHQ
ncbi:MAG: hypothetical protein JXP48_06415 [Acidobacteria bacterium]|nr:hypothetical protein [Acidobacteriota bacterium]